MGHLTRLRVSFFYTMLALDNLHLYSLYYDDHTEL